MIRYRDTVKAKLETIQGECAEKDRLKGELSKKLQEKEQQLRRLNTELDEVKQATHQAAIT